MKKLLLLYILLFSVLFSAQTDYSASWEDFYSYNNVKDFVKVDNVIYALADNAVFTYDVTTNEIEKLSSVQGLSGEITSAIHYSSAFERLVIGYENGLVEVVDKDGLITISSDIVSFNQSGEKSINDITEYNNKLYLSTPFAIVAYDIDKLEFGDTYFIGAGSSAVKINETTVLKDVIYAATEDGIYTADINETSLIDFNNWQRQFNGRNFKELTTFNNRVFTISETKLYEINGENLNERRDFFQTIISIKSTASSLSVTLNKFSEILNASLSTILKINTTSDFDFSLNNSFFENDTIFLATKEYGILQKNKNSIDYIEIHPEGPIENDIFSIAASNNNVWVVYGGYDDTYTPIGNRIGFISHYNKGEPDGEKWKNINLNAEAPFTDLNHITIDPNAENKVYVSSFGDTNITSINNKNATGGLLVIENDELKTFYNDSNSSLEDIVADIPNRVTIRVSGTVFDPQGNLWVTNVLVDNELHKLSTSGNWSSFDMRSVETDVSKAGISEIAIDNNNSLWYGARANGVYVFNENGNRKKALIATPNLGNLPDANVESVAIDVSNRVWIGTRSGLVMYNNASGVFDDTTPNANAVVINGNEEGFGERLLGDQRVNSIAIDGADNKWFGTDNGGVIYTNPNGQTTLANFSMDNSPLPSNKIVKIAVDNSTGKVYFATNKGIVAYNSKVSPFGDVIPEVYAYPNPALKNHETVTIDGRNGAHLPKGTNVKIIDVAGNLVYETNVVEGQELQGGKVVWDKKNLAGTKVASGIYIVLLSNDDASETGVTKIAIVN
ncbi:hypothetical protein [Polaribacter sp. Q13]|uniref:type IX secretion system anionic LPS delivery protein PorZ n=1 Tax=Polaribacter sp. Q13 TaxID=2806551 RepID=UPI00193C48F1|nr:hypothetical protein [Polaribacter sp. Q13]QVY64700.1 hypothetical protein JOP69_13115 [Polaribacter sp. Q13]